MGVYAITGASSGIGAKTKELPAASKRTRRHQHRPEGRRHPASTWQPRKQAGNRPLYDKSHEAACPEGLDGMICNAGVSGACGNLSLIVSLNYFGTLAIAKGAYDLLGKDTQAA